LKLQNYKITKLHNPQRGYMLIMLMLVIALAAMALLAVLPQMAQQIRRNQEEEMRHRGTSYMRAIQHYYTKLGRYPSRIEDLEETNKIRFLRKRYKDPLSRDPKTGKEKDFKLLHMQDVNVVGGPQLGGGQPPVLPGQNGSPLTPGQATQPNAGPQTTPAEGQAPNAAGEEDSEPGNPATPQSNPTATPNSPSNPSGGSSAGNGFNGPVFGGGPILGVASTSKAKSIREFNKKNHYNEWIFIFDPNLQKTAGGLLVGPWQPPTTMGIPGAVPVGGQQPGPGGQATPGTGPGFSQPGGGQSPNPVSQPPQSPEQNAPQE
jgi:type II secretory pathway pseudopilin PulG